MILTWQWPIAFLIAVAALLGIFLLLFAFGAFRRRQDPEALKVFDLDDDMQGERTSTLMRQWRNLGRIATAALALALALAIMLVARPSQVDQGQERIGSRDIVLCLDVSGSTLPYDREVIDTYLSLVSGFQGERIGMSIFNSTSRTVFPLTDDYELVASQLKAASTVLKGVESQKDIDRMSDADYQKISDWLEGTQNRANETSLIGDGVVSCAAMLPGFAYGSAAAGQGGQQEPAGPATRSSTRRQRSASIVLATDNVVSGKPTYTLAQALDLASQAHISVDGLYSGPTTSEGDGATTQMRTLIQSHGGSFVTQHDNRSVNDLVRDIETRQHASVQSDARAAVIDTPGWWALALAVLTALWLSLAWRLRR
ncbi:MAG: VWA domain-containing protein [Bifidobacterium sp.]|nr:VWA domain-containing protein [Bifidobacterium sp.]